MQFDAVSVMDRVGATRDHMASNAGMKYAVLGAVLALVVAFIIYGIYHSRKK